MTVSIPEKWEKRQLEELVRIGSGPNQSGIYKADSFRHHRAALCSLEDHGLVKKIDRPEEKFVFYSLTAKGRKVYQKVFEAFKGDEISGTCW